MTIIKSLKYEPKRLGQGHIHRVHRSKKNRKYVRPADLNAKRQKNQILNQLHEQELIEDNGYDPTFLR